MRRQPSGLYRPGRRFCWLTWMELSRIGRQTGMGQRTLQVAHIASGAGKAVRVDDRRAVLVTVASLPFASCE